MDEDYQMFKIVVIGSMGTGKTNISTRYIRNQYNDAQKSTVGVEFLSKIVQVRNQNIKVTLWDTAGQQRYKSLSKVYYKGASGILIVYDVTDPQSYLDVQSWMRLANQNLNLNEVVLMVVGNKVDIQGDRKVPTDRPLKQYKDKFDIDCWQVSAKTGYNVKQVFNQLLQRIYEKNIQIKQSAFQQGSDWGGSVVDPNTNSMIQRQTLKKPMSNIPQVIVQEDQPKMNKMNKINKNNVPPVNGKEAGNKQKKVVLTKQKTQKKKKQKGGCC